MGLFGLSICATQSLGAAAQAPTKTGLVAIDVLLEPDAGMVEAARAVNEKLRLAYPAGYSLDASHAPHVTLLQRYVRESDLKAISAVVAKILEREPLQSLRLSARGYYAAPWGDAQVLVLIVEHTPELVRLQAAVAEALAPYAVSGGGPAAFARDASGEMDAETIAYVEAFVPKSSGTNFQPHITVGVGSDAAMKSIKAAPFQPQAFSPKALAIFQLGRFGTAQKRLWTSGQP
jgi:2'-5' RNA ligase